VIEHRPLQAVSLGRQVGNAVRRVGDDLGRLRAAETLVVDRLFEQRIEGRCNVQIEVRDLRELAQ